MKFNEILEKWTTRRTFAYLGAASACAAAATAYKRAQAKGFSRMYALLAVLWSALAAGDIWISQQDDFEDDDSNVDDWGTSSAT